MKKITTVIVGIALALSFAPDAGALANYSGSMSTYDGTVGATGLYANRGFWISWNITEMEDGWWRYEYSVTNLLPVRYDEISISLDEGMFGLGVASTAYDGLFRGVSTNMTIGTMDIDGGAFHQDNALLFEVNDNYFSFESKYVPAWGDFFATYGEIYNTTTGLIEPNRAWNSGFAAADPGASPGNGAYMNKLLRPDTTSAIPEPATMLLFGLGLAGASVYRKMRGREK